MQPNLKLAKYQWDMVERLVLALETIAEAVSTPEPDTMHCTSFECSVLVNKPGPCHMHWL